MPISNPNLSILTNASDLDLNYDPDKVEMGNFDLILFCLNQILNHVSDRSRSEILLFWLQLGVMSLHVQIITRLCRPLLIERAQISILL